MSTLRANTGLKNITNFEPSIIYVFNSNTIKRW